MPNLTRENRELAESLGALANPLRVAIVLALRGGPMRVTAIAERQEISLTSASIALRRLSMAGLVGRERHGQGWHYGLNHEAVRRLGGRVIELAGEDGRRKGK